MASDTFKDRIKELRRVRAGDLMANPKNWRTHPENQKSALVGMLKDVGWADALIARETADGSLELVDGHLRAGLDPELMVPVLVTDLTEAEAQKVLLTLDPISSMAGADEEALRSLISDVKLEIEAMDHVWESLNVEPMKIVDNESTEAVVIPDTVDTRRAVKLVQLIFDDHTFAEFNTAEARMRGILGTTNVTDTVLLVMREAGRDVS